MLRLIAICSLLASFALSPLAPAAAQGLPAGADPQNALVIDTTQGRIVVKLRNDIAPQHAARLKQLARDKFYDNVPFNRGIVGMARKGGNNDSANSQFFIMYADGAWPQLNGQYTVIGEVLSGMDVADKIKKGEPVQDPDRMLTVRVEADLK